MMSERTPGDPVEPNVRQRLSDLEYSNRLKDLFTSIMDHDIKNYLTSILGYSALLARRSEGEIQTYSHIIEENAKKINALITDVRTFSMIQDADLMKKRVRLELFETVKPIHDELKSKAETKQVELALDVPPGRYYFEGLPLISEVFRNLIDNAIKYSGRGSKVEIYTEERGERFVFCVKDRGAGVPDAYKEIIFNRFERLDYHIKEGIEGSGLGLAISRALVNLHQGRIWAEDNPAGGAIFKVELTRSRT